MGEPAGQLLADLTVHQEQGDMGAAEDARRTGCFAAGGAVPWVHGAGGAVGPARRRGRRRLRHLPCQYWAPFLMGLNERILSVATARSLRVSNKWCAFDPSRCTLYSVGQ